VSAPVPLAVPSDLLHQRPDILAAEAAVRSAAEAAGAATASMFPSLTLSAAYGRGGFDWGTFSSPAGAIWSAGAILTQPLFHGGALAARRREYRARYEVAVDQYRHTVLGAFQNVADTLASLEADEEVLQQAHRSAAAAQALRDDLEGRRELGAVPLVVALGARQQHESAQLALIRAETARLADTAELYQAMGDPRLSVTSSLHYATPRNPVSVR
jgi:outer membrane protein TolC